MKNLLDFYKEHVQIDPEVTQESITEALGMANNFQRTKLDYLYSIYSDTISELQNYRDYMERGFPEYFKSVSGNKIIKVVGGRYMGVLDLWYPRETNLFNISRNPIMASWVIQDLLTKMDKIEDILKFSDPSSTLMKSLENLFKEISETEFYGFWMGDARNSARKRGIKIRKLEVIKIEMPKNYSACRFYPDMTMKDKETKEELVFDKYNLEGWSFYLSKELLSERLSDLESLWMRGYDQKVKALDQEVKTKRKELENLINRRSEFENGIGEYKKKLHRLLWKSF